MREHKKCFIKKSFFSSFFILSLGTVLSCALAFSSCQNLFETEVTDIHEEEERIFNKPDSAKSDSENQIPIIVSGTLTIEGAVPEQVIQAQNAQALGLTQQSLQQESSRSAVPLLDFTEVEYFVTAVSGTKTVKGTFGTGTAATTFSIPLTSGLEWNITCGLKKKDSGSTIGDTLFSQTKEGITPESITDANPLRFFPTPTTGVDSTGQINLEMTIDGTISSVELTCVGTNSSSWPFDAAVVSGTTATIQTDPATPAIASVPSGKYEVVFNFYRTDDSLAYQTIQTINVCKGLTTHKWIASGGDTPIESDGTFNVSAAKIAQFVSTNYYVGTVPNLPSGVSPLDTNSGSHKAPFATLGKAISKIQTLATATGAPTNLTYTIHVYGTVDSTSDSNVPSIGSAFNDKAAKIIIQGHTLAATPDTLSGIQSPAASSRVLNIETTVPVELNNLSITGGNASGTSGADSYGGGLYINGTGTNVTINNTSIEGNSAYKQGGGVYIGTGATFNMKGTSVIKENMVVSPSSSTSADTKTAGGGVYVAAGASFIMDSGTISANGSYDAAGAVFVRGTFTMNDGTITSNKNTRSASGVTSNIEMGTSGMPDNPATFNMKGGTITSTLEDGWDGSAVCMYAELGHGDSSGSIIFNMSGGSITGIHNVSHGAAVYMVGQSVTAATYDLKFNMSGGSITGNVSKHYAGAVYVGKSSSFIMTGGEISGNQMTGVGSNSLGAVVYDTNITSTFSPSIILGKAGSTSTVKIKNNTGSSASDVRNVYLNAVTQKINVAGPLSAESEVGVTRITTPLSSAFTNGFASTNSIHPSDVFTSDSESYEVVADSSGEAKLAAPGTNCRLQWYYAIGDDCIPLEDEAAVALGLPLVHQTDSDTDFSLDKTSSGPFYDAETSDASIFEGDINLYDPGLVDAGLSPFEAISSIGETDGVISYRIPADQITADSFMYIMLNVGTVYLDPVNGDNDNGGWNKDIPVKTVAHAKKLLKNNTRTNPAIMVMSTLTSKTDIENLSGLTRTSTGAISEYNGAIVKRHSECDEVIKPAASENFTLSNVTFDGGAVWSKSVSDISSDIENLTSLTNSGLQKTKALITLTSGEYTFENVTIQNCDNTSTSAGSSAAINIQNSATANLSGCTIKQCRAKYGAVGVPGILNATDTSFIANYATYRGGAVYGSSEDTKVKFDGCSFLYNGAGDRGGAVNIGLNWDYATFIGTSAAGNNTTVTGNASNLDTPAASRNSLGNFYSGRATLTLKGSFNFSDDVDFNIYNNLESHAICLESDFTNSSSNKAKIYVSKGLAASAGEYVLTPASGSTINIATAKAFFELAGENASDYVISDDGKIANPPASGNIYTALDYEFTLSITKNKVKKGVSSVITVTPAVKRNEPGGGQTDLYYNPADQKLYENSAFTIPAGGDNTVSFAASLWCGIDEEEDTVTAGSGADSNKFTISALTFEDDYTLNVTVTYMGVAHDASFAVRCVEAKTNEFYGDATLCADDADRKSSVFIKDRPITISATLWACDHETTQGEYETYCFYGGGSSNEPSDTYGKGTNYPAYYVSWYDAIVYCNLRSIAEGKTACYKLGSSTDPKTWTGVVAGTGANAGKYCGPSSTSSDWNGITCDFEANGYRLPTQAEWEYLARGKNLTNDGQTIYSGSDIADDVVWHSGNASGKSHEVGGLAANDAGLYDMCGNVWEWCWDWTGAINASTPATGNSSGVYRRYLGGSWNFAASTAKICSSSSSYSYARNYFTGFRVVRTAE